MSDILADYRIWKSQQEERIGTHSKRCHLWPRHERCMIHRLAAELEKSRQAIRRLAEQDATLSVCDGNVTVTMDATLTDAEREAVELAIDSMNGVEDISASWSQRETAAIATLRCLLQRHFPAPENPPEQDNCPPADENLPSGIDAPNLHSNPDEVSVPWMARPCWVDPPEGWRYGFPKLYDPANNGDLNAWLIANGYPQHLADQNLPCTFTAKIDSQ